MLCRGPEDLPRAKSRALGKDTLCRGQPQEPSAKNGPRQRGICRGYGPRQRQAHGKSNLCRGPRPSAKMPSARPVGSRRPFPVKLCRGPPVRPSTKVFFSCATRLFGKFFFKSLPRALDQALGKDFFKTSFLANFFFINRLCRGPEARPSAKKPFAEGPR